MAIEIVVQWKGEKESGAANVAERFGIAQEAGYRPPRAYNYIRHDGKGEVIEDNRGKKNDVFDLVNIDQAEKEPLTAERWMKVEPKPQEILVRLT
jgi:hypothetical protein